MPQSTEDAYNDLHRVNKLKLYIVQTSDIDIKHSKSNTSEFSATWHDLLLNLFFHNCRLLVQYIDMECSRNCRHFRKFKRMFQYTKQIQFPLITLNLNYILLQER